MQRLHQCLQCAYSAQDPNTPMEMRLQGKEVHHCLRRPPTMVGAVTAQGIIAIAVYPTVTRESVSCAEYSNPSTLEERHGN